MALFIFGAGVEQVCFFKPQFGSFVSRAASFVVAPEAQGGVTGLRRASRCCSLGERRAASGSLLSVWSVAQQIAGADAGNQSALRLPQQRRGTAQALGVIFEGQTVDWKQYVSVAALVFSLVSFGFTYSLSSRSAVTSVRPVLVFEYDQADGWSVRNVGNGPALNVLIASKSASDWQQPVRIPPVQKDGRIALHWLGHLNVRTLGASYADIANRQYSSTCTDDLSRTFDSNELPSWPESQIQAHWKLLPAQG
jgi:hypothetical protein